MQIHLETGGQANLIRSYGPGQLLINDDVYQSSLIVMPDRIIADWPPRHFGDLDLPHMQVLAGLGTEVILIGTGQRQRFPRSALLAPLAGAGTGWEIMDTGAACRTYNFLLGEGRRVAAALLMIEA